METTPSPTPPPDAPVPLSPELQALPGQFRRLLRAFAVLSVLIATLQLLELWRCWSLREGARRAGQLRAMQQQLMATTEDFRRVAAGNPELVALGRKYGLEPLPPSGGAAANPSARP